MVENLDPLQPMPQELVDACVKYRTDSGGLPADEAPSLLVALIHHLDQCYIVIDGLDEYVAQEKTNSPRYPIDIFEDLYNVTKKCRDRCRMLVSSRDHVFHSYMARSIDAWHIEIEAHKDDVANYVRFRIEDPGFAHHGELKGSDKTNIRQKIIDKLCECAKGMFVSPPHHIDKHLTSRKIHLTVSSLKDDRNEG
jgi:hypothetical protein